jgi:uncharacterized protein YdeI (YjbR/CyaY-like superfamily)
MKPTHFANAAAFRRWLEKNHAACAEFVVGFYKKDSGRGGLTYAEAVDEALCFGWIDGIVRRIDEFSYCHRFTPRKPGSIWSNTNVTHVARLTAAGKMHAAGLAAYASRDPAKTGIYSFEKTKAPPALPPSFARRFKAHPAAWNFFRQQPPGYRRLQLHHIVEAKQEATRLRRLEKLIAASAAGRRLT